MVPEMKRLDLEELYQLLKLYAGTYGEKEAGRMLTEAEECYRSRYLEDIRGKRNPGRAGRKRRYMEETKGGIQGLRREGQTIRETAKETGCPAGYIQGVLSGPIGQGCPEINY